MKNIFAVLALSMISLSAFAYSNAVNSMRNILFATARYEGIVKVTGHDDRIISIVATNVADEGQMATLQVTTQNGCVVDVAIVPESNDCDKCQMQDRRVVQVLKSTGLCGGQPVTPKTP